MKKSLYLKLSQQEANKKLQSSLYVSYKSIKQRNKLLGWLYFVFTYISFSIVAIVSFIHRLVMLPKDFRFTPHYLRTIIRHENMTLVEANAYLDSQLHEYKNSLSFGNFSPQDRNSIDTTFELLYNEYKLLEPEDTKHTAIISGLSEVKSLSLANNTSIEVVSSSMTNQHAEIVSRLTDINDSDTRNITSLRRSITSLDINIKKEVATVKDEFVSIKQSIDDTHNTVTGTSDKIDELSSKQETVILGLSCSHRQLSNISDEITSVKSTLDPIASYTEAKHQREEAEQQKENELRKKQEKRKSSAYNREKGKKLSCFEADLSEKQIMVLVEYCNKVSVFDRDIELQEMKDLLLCLHKKPFKLTVNKYLALLFTELAENQLICKTWKSVAQRHKCFISSNNKVQTSKDLDSANRTSGFIDPKINDLIIGCVDEIMQFHRK